MHDCRLKTSSGWTARVRVCNDSITVWREGLTSDGAPVDELVLTWASKRVKKDFALVIDGLHGNSIDVENGVLALSPRPDKTLKLRLEAREEEQDRKSWWAVLRRSAEARESFLNGE